MHCGFLPRSRWAPGRKGLPRALGPDPYTAEVCPGWLVRQPAVVEAAKLWEANEAGMLERMNPDNLHVVNEAVIRLRRAFGLYQVERQRAMQRRLGEGR